MKTKVSFLLLLTSFAFSQDKMELIYKVSSAGFSDDLIDGKNELIREYILNAEEELKDLTYKLQIDKQESIWFLNNKNSYSNDNMGKSIGGNSTYFFNNLNEKYCVQKEFLKQLFIIEEKKKEFNWKLINETKTILGFICKKATSEIIENINGVEKIVETEAWYCPEIKHKIGPENFNGLDGLILELTNRKRKFYCTEVLLADKMSLFVIHKPTIGKQIKEEEFIKEQERISKNNGIPFFKD